MGYKMRMSQMRKLRHQDGRGKHEPATDMEKYSRGNRDGCPKWIVGREARLVSPARAACVFMTCLGTGYKRRMAFKVRNR